MIDLVCLVADKSIEAAIDGVLRRPQAIGIRAIRFESVVHPRRDPGCFHEPGEILAGYADRASHALVVLDHAWVGAPADSGAELERLLDESLRRLGPAEWAQAVVIDPELEVWAFSESPHVAAALGWTGSMEDLRAALGDEGLWNQHHRKPEDPKAAVDWVLRRAKRPRSSSIFRELSTKVSLERCEDRSFLRLTGLLRGWFGEEHPSP